MNDSLIDDCKKYLGLPPYDSWTNVSAHDGHYYKYLCSKYGQNRVEDMLRKLEVGVEE